MATSYVKDDQGSTFIAASQRPDGTWRKPRRVRDGYVPQEEVPLYESLGKQFQKNKHPVGVPVGMSLEFLAAHKAKVEAEYTRTTIPGLVLTNETKKKKKKSKSKAVSSLTEELSKASITESKSTVKVDKSEKKSNPVTNRDDSKPVLSDNMKRLKHLRKKLREIETLEAKIKSGDIKKPEKEVLDKVSRKQEIKDEIQLLESNQ